MLSIVYAAPIIQDWDKARCLTTEGVPTLKCFEVLFSNLLVMTSGLIAIVLFIMFVVGSFNYLTSAGNPEKIKKAQGTFTYAIVGTLLFIGSFIILKIIDILFLGGQGALFKFRIGE